MTIENQIIDVLQEIANNTEQPAAIAISTAAQNITKILNDNPRIRSLCLSDKYIGAEGGKALAAVLKSNSTLTSLDLSRNSIGAAGAIAIAEALKENQTLTTLNLYYNCIKDEGGIALAEALKENTTLTTLNLNDNNIEDEGAKAIAEALKANQTLISLNLNGCRIEDEGARAIEEALKANQTLISLNLNGCRIEDEGARAIEEGMEWNFSLREFCADGISDKTIKYISQNLQIYERYNDIMPMDVIYESLKSKEDKNDNTPHLISTIKKLCNSGILTAAIQKEIEDLTQISQQKEAEKANKIKDAKKAAALKKKAESLETKLKMILNSEWYDLIQKNEQLTAENVRKILLDMDPTIYNAVSSSA